MGDYMGGKGAKLPVPEGGFSEEQKRLWEQVDIIQRDLEMRPFGQPYSRSHGGVDKKTGEEVPYRDIEKRKDDLLRDEKGRILSPEEKMMIAEGWGRPCDMTSKDGAWCVNANVGIRTHGDDALHIVLVETKGKPWRTEKTYDDKTRELGETRRWEYHVSRKGQDAGKEENVLKVPVFSMAGPGLLCDIGNKGSTYTSDGTTTKNFQPQKVQRHADDLEVIVPRAAGMGDCLVVTGRDSFEAFSSRKGYTGCTITVPKGSIDHVRRGHTSNHIQLRGAGDNWSELIYISGLTAEQAEDNKKQFKDSLYAINPMPQDEVTFREGADGKADAKLSVPALDGGSPIPESAEVRINGNTGTGASVHIGNQCIKAPPQGFNNNVLSAWSSPPIWVHGPGEKGSIDLSGLDGRIVIGGGGHILTSQKKPNVWWYAEVILAGGSKEQKAVYTIEVPQFEDPKLKLDLVREKADRQDLHLRRYPMPPYQTIPLQYPDGSTVQIGQTENDVISIRGDHIEVRIKEGEKITPVYDSDKPELNSKTGILTSGMMVGGAMLMLDRDRDGQGAQAEPSRRQFLGGTAALAAGAGLAALIGSHDSGPAANARVEESAVRSHDPVAASVSELFPDARVLGNGRIAMQNRPHAHTAPGHSGSAMCL